MLLCWSHTIPTFHSSAQEEKSYPAPQILPGSLVNTTAVEGSTVVLECKVKSQHLYSVHWYRGKHDGLKANGRTQLRKHHGRKVRRGGVCVCTGWWQDTHTYRENRGMRSSREWGLLWLVGKQRYLNAWKSDGSWQRLLFWRHLPNIVMMVGVVVGNTDAMAAACWWWWCQWWWPPLPRPSKHVLKPINSHQGKACQSVCQIKWAQSDSNVAEILAEERRPSHPAQRDGQGYGLAHVHGPQRVWTGSPQCLVTSHTESSEDSQA